MDQADIPHAIIGQKGIHTEDFNRMVDSTNKFENTNYDPSSVDYFTEDRHGRSTLTRNTIINDFPFRIEDYVGIELSVHTGSWVRNQTIVDLGINGIGEFNELNEKEVLISIDDFQPEPAEGKTFYIYVQLEANVNSEAFGPYITPALFPGELNVYVSSDAEDAGTYTPKELIDIVLAGGIDDLSLIRKNKQIIGTVELVKVDLDGADTFFVSNIKQLINEDISDIQQLHDAAALDKSPDGHYRASISYNLSIDYPDNTGNPIHAGELQLHNIEHCCGEESCSIPFFKAGYEQQNEDNNVGVTGELEWAAIDSEYFPPSGGEHKTLEVWIDQIDSNKPFTGQTYKALGLYGATDVSQTNASMIVYYDTTSADSGGQMQGEIKYAALDTDHTYPSDSYSSLVIDTDEGVIGLTNFVGGGGGSSLDDNSTFLFRDEAQITTIKYATKEEMVGWLDITSDFTCQDVYDCLDDNFDCSWIWDCFLANPDKFKHSNLTDIPNGNFDHTAYWVNGDLGFGAGGTAPADETQNFGIAIGNLANAKILSMENQAIYDTNSNEIMGWGATACSFTGTTQVNVLSSITASLGSGALKVTGGAYLGNGIYVDKGNAAHGGYFKDTITSVSLCNQSWAGNFIMGTTNVKIADGTSIITGTGDIKITGTTGAIHINGDQVVTKQQATVNNSTVTSSSVSEVGSDEDSVARAEINKLVTDVTDVSDTLNDLIGKLQTHGLIA